jgi:hypothetical protein
MLIRGDVAFHDYEGVAVDLDERERLVADLGDQECDDPAQPRHARGRQECRRMLHPPLLSRARVPGADHGAVGRRGINNPPQGSPEITAQQGAVGLPLAANLLAWPALKRKAYRLDPSFAWMKLRSIFSLSNGKLCK